MRRQLLQGILKSQRSISGLFVICRVLLVVCLYAKELRGAKTVMYSDGLKEDSSLQGRLFVQWCLEFIQCASSSTLSLFNVSV